MSRVNQYADETYSANTKLLGFEEDGALKKYTGYESGILIRAEANITAGLTGDAASGNSVYIIRWAAMDNL